MTKGGDSTMVENKLINDRYRIDSNLGQGGFATVYRGTDTQTGHKVAIKQLKKEVISVDPDIVERFAREGEALRRLNHPNIVKVLDTAQQDGESYVIMEYVSGGDLHTLVSERRRKEEMLSIQRVLEIALDLSDALTRAHRLQIIHRDIKPANVLLAHDGTPRLTDFGVAHFGDSTRMTQSGAMIGTLSYLSPEACAGEDIDQRADIWSFGVMLYEMLALRRPFDENNTAALLTAILSKEPVPLDTIRDDIPADLANLVSQMLVKDRDQRISSVRLVGAQLEAILTGAELPQALDPTPTPMESISARGTLTPTTTTPGQPDTPTATQGQATLPVEMTPPPATATPTVVSQPQRFPLGTILGVVAVLVAVAALVIVLVTGGDSDNVTTDDSVTENPTDAVLTVDPVPDGTYMVLVAQMEPVGTEERDVSRFIVDDLRAVFDDGLAFSLIRPRLYDSIITSEEQALAAAEANGAAVVIWGNYDSDTIDVNVQLGSLAPFPKNTLDRDDLEALVNVRLRMTSERTQSLSSSVVAAFNTLHTSESNAFGVAANLTILDLARPENPEVIGNNMAAFWHRYLFIYHSDPVLALDMVNRAIELDSQNATLYLGRTLAYIRAGELSGLFEDIDTARQFGPEGWPMPFIAEGQYRLILENDPDGALANLEQVNLFALGDWWAHTIAGATYLTVEDYDLAHDHLYAAMELEPPSNFPYVYASALAFREGDMVEAQRIVTTVRDQFPDPTLGTRLLTSSYGEVNTAVSLSIEAFGHFVLGQWSDAIAAAEAAAELPLTYSDTFLTQGVAYCNQQNYEAAEAAYTRLIEREPDYYAAYALRAEVRQYMGDTAGSLQDIATILNGEQREQYAPLLDLFTAGEVTCENFLDVDYATLLEEES